MFLERMRAVARMARCVGCVVVVVGGWGWVAWVIREVEAILLLAEWIC